MNSVKEARATGKWWLWTVICASSKNSCHKQIPFPCEVRPFRCTCWAHQSHHFPAFIFFFLFTPTDIQVDKIEAYRYNSVALLVVASPKRYADDGPHCRPLGWVKQQGYWCRWLHYILEGFFPQVDAFAFTHLFTQTGRQLPNSDGQQWQEWQKGMRRKTIRIKVRSDVESEEGEEQEREWREQGEGKVIYVSIFQGRCYSQANQ